MSAMLFKIQVHFCFARAQFTLTTSNVYKWNILILDSHFCLPALIIHKNANYNLKYTYEMCLWLHLNLYFNVCVISYFQQGNVLFNICRL